MFGGLVDATSPTATFDGVHGSDINPLAAKPARIEDFTFVRGGGFAAIQARFAAQTARVRVDVTAGVGAAYKVMAMQRHGHATEAGKTDWQEEPYIPRSRLVLLARGDGERRAGSN